MDKEMEEEEDEEEEGDMGPWMMGKVDTRWKFGRLCLA